MPNKGAVGQTTRTHKEASSEWVWVRFHHPQLAAYVRAEAERLHVYPVDVVRGMMQSEFEKRSAR